jgi:precorrin-6B methylase 2
MKKILIFTAASLALVGLIWRLYSRRHEIPCPTWLAWMVESDNPFTKVNRAKTIVEHLNVKPGMSVLDAGCGPGRLTLPLAEAVGPQGSVMALDLQEGMLSRVREKVQNPGLQNVEFLQAEIDSALLLLPRIRPTF